LQGELPTVVERPEKVTAIVSHGTDKAETQIEISPKGEFVIPIPGPYKPWDTYMVDMSLRLNTKFTVDDLPMDRPTLEITPDGGADKTETLCTVQDYHYQSRLNAYNFLDAPRWFYFPH